MGCSGKFLADGESELQCVKNIWSFLKRSELNIYVDVYRSSKIRWAVEKYALFWISQLYDHQSSTGICMNILWSSHQHPFHWPCISIRKYLDFLVLHNHEVLYTYSVLCMKCANIYDKRVCAFLG